MVTSDVFKGGLNRKHHFDFLRDKLDMDVVPKELNISFNSQQRQVISILLNLYSLFKYLTRELKLENHVFHQIEELKTRLTSDPITTRY